MKELDNDLRRENLSVGAVIEDLDHKIAVASNEICKWTDNSFLVAQCILAESERMRD